jgi:aspartyl protease family protein
MKTLSTIVLLGLVFLLSGCDGCSRSARQRTAQRARGQKPRLRVTDNGTCTIRMNKVHGVFEVPVTINGVNMSFIFDTGASIVSISQKEASLLMERGSLTEEDVLGMANFTDANGDVSEGTIVRLRSMQLCGRELQDVEASVVPNQIAPLLLGQTALGYFGEITIDNHQETITFK